MPGMAQAAKTAKQLLLLAAITLLALAAVPSQLEATRYLPSTTPPATSPPGLEALDVAGASRPLSLLTAEDRFLFAAAVLLDDAEAGQVLAGHRHRLFPSSCPLPRSVELAASAELATGLPAFVWPGNYPECQILSHESQWPVDLLSEDPLGAVDSPNRYAFVAWGPQAKADPLGLYWCYEGEVCVGPEGEFEGWLKAPPSMRAAPAEDLLPDTRYGVAGDTALRLGVAPINALNGFDNIARTVIYGPRGALPTYLPPSSKAQAEADKGALMLMTIPIVASFVPGGAGMPAPAPEVSLTGKRLPIADVEGWQHLGPVDDVLGPGRGPAPPEPPPAVRGGTTYQQRINQTPKRNGWWSAERGESTFYSYDAEVSTVLRGSGVHYENAIPDLSAVSVAEVRIAGMSIDRNLNFQLADEAAAAQISDPTVSPRDIAMWRKQNGYTWHELSDLETMQLVPTRVNTPVFGHVGGVGEINAGAQLVTTP
jgi:hypothetical protein